MASEDPVSLAQRLRRTWSGVRQLPWRVRPDADVAVAAKRVLVLGFRAGYGATRSPTLSASSGSGNPLSAT
ncbi:MAG: hypothetical protein WBP81_22345, partial [Solirubrobacteraceae bacterium]